MKTKLIALTYRGSASVDPRFSASMLPWCINDIRSMDNYNKLSVGIENGLLEAYNGDFELQFSHNLKYVVGMCRITHKNGRNGYYIQIKTSNGGIKLDMNNFMEFSGPINGIVYLIKDPRDPLLHVYLYESNSIDEMTELMHQMRDPVQTLGGSVGNIPQTFVGNSGNGSNTDITLQKAIKGNGGVHSTPASNLKLSEACRNAQHDSSPNLISSKMSSSKSYTHGLSNSAGTVNNITSSNSASSNLSLLGDISPNHTHFFEVMYVGKIRVSHKRVPFTFIDDALPKFKAYDAQRTRLIQLGSNQTNRSSLVSDGSIENVSATSSTNNINESVEVNSNNNNNNNSNENTDDNDENDSVYENENHDDKIIIIPTTVTATDCIKDVEETNELKIVEEYDNKKKQINELPDSIENVCRQIDSVCKSEKKDIPLEPEIIIENKLLTKLQNKKVLTRGHSQIVLSLKKDGASVVGVSNSNNSHNNNKLLPPPPQLPSPSITAEFVPKQRDRSASYGSIPPYVEQNRTMVFLVGRSDLRLISPDRKQVLLYKEFKDVASCAQGNKNGDHFGIICREGHSDGYIGYVFKCQSDHVCDDIVAAISQAFITCSEQKNKEKSQIFSCEHCPMLWYHKLCSDIEALNDKKTQAMIFRRIETLSDDEQDIIWAKYYGAENNHNLSEQNQFLMMLLRAHCESRQQRHVHDTAENRSEFLNQYLGGSTIFMKAKRSLTSSFDHLLKRRGSKDEFGIQHNVRDSQIKESLSEGSNSSGGENNNGSDSNGFRSRSNTLTSTSPNKPPSAEQLKSPMMDIFIKVGNSSPKDSLTHQGSWRQAILNSVVTPSKTFDNTTDNRYLSPLRITQSHRGKRTKEELRELWKTAIRQTILLSRMETENAMLQARQNENEMKKIKLDYDEICSCDKQLIDRWEKIIEHDSIKVPNKRDPKLLLGAIKNGVPRSKRGDVWTFLAEQHSMNTAPVDIKKFPNFNTPYYTLLKNLTEHQHAIFIDLGRTFPNHKYYKDPLGVGQLSLFNLLKAYSILDPELGYCQGLGFICGILLLHCEEADAFELLKHLMFRRKMRTKYLPDMKKFQLQLYQLSRLVKDNLPDLYDWLDKNDVSPTLYAAPWLLTVFSSQFPLGFVARIFDLLFLESSEIIFKAAIALLTVHKDEILLRDNFEDIMDYLKNIVPKIDNIHMGKIMKAIFQLDINKQLTEYQVEYNVLQEEITTTNRHLDLLNREKINNQHLETQLQFAQSSIAQLEKTRASQQTQITSLQSQVQTLELTIQNLGRFVTELVDSNIDIDLPSDIRRIVQQLDDIEKQRKKPLFTERKIGKSLSVNSHLGYPSSLKVLEELNERENSDPSSPIKSKKTSYFESTYEQLRQQRSNQRPNRFLDNTTTIQPQNTIENRKGNTENVFAWDKSIIKSPIEVDSGVGTPISPPESQLVNNDDTSKITLSASDTKSLELLNDDTKNLNVHPLSGDVNVRFNGTKQLKTLRSRTSLSLVSNGSRTSSTESDQTIKSSRS